ncbi:PilZ domain-containing protein [Cohnella cholangitidis]|uniref:PilZ domain-containing protein n=1 Tax=Cohnella cholangitidis TaxID=2598458 RepID=A0A7G5C1Y0_9BACL|nr:PilZ domain-containing protein [Cohnella cholangitidis]QMV43214.1 PilZ domain-containing protein [Cohnella cholangitidis]
MDGEWVENRRQHLRFQLTVPLFAELSLWQIREREMRSRSQRVMLNNISVGGCLFATALVLPVRDDVEWLLKLQLGHYTVKARAVILHAGQEDGLSRYGVRWIMSGMERQAFQYRLNEYMRMVLVSSPHIHTLYNKISERKADGQFKKFDITS